MRLIAKALRAGVWRARAPSEKGRAPWRCRVRSERRAVASPVEEFGPGLVSNSSKQD